MKTLEHLTESDFEYELPDGTVIPVLDFGEESEYYITYGHIPVDEMEQHVRTLIKVLGEDPDDREIWGTLDDVSWSWALAFNSDYEDEPFQLTFKDVTEDTEGSFPVTILSVW